MEKMLVKRLHMFIFTYVLNILSMHYKERINNLDHKMIWQNKLKNIEDYLNKVLSDFNLIFYPVISIYVYLFFKRIIDK
jgi:hypothetical protein